MNKVKVLRIIALGLLATNLVLIWFLLSHKPPHGKHENPKKMIIEKLHLDEQQTKKYEKLILEHRASLQKSERQIKQLKHQLYATLKDEEGTKEADSLISEIGTVQQKIEQIHYNHFLDIKQLCKSEQLKAFDELTAEIPKLFAPKKGPKLHGPKP